MMVIVWAVELFMAFVEPVIVTIMVSLPSKRASLVEDMVTMPVVDPAGILRVAEDIV